MEQFAAMSSAFDYFSPIPIQNSITDRVVREITPLNALQVGTPFEFLVLGGEGDRMYLDLAQSSFYFRVRVRTSANAAPIAAAEVSCVNNLAHSMFQRIQVFLGNKEVGDSNALYPFRAYCANLLFRSKDAQESWMVNQGWYGRDTAGKFDEFRTADAQNTNKGVLARHKVIGLGAEFEMLMHPEVDIFNSDKYIPPGVQVKIRFTPENNAFILKRGAGEDKPVLEILEAKFYCHTVKATAGQDMAIIEALRDIGPIRINGVHTTVKNMSIASGNTTAELDNIFYGPIPNRVIMFMVRDDALSGNYARNPFNFQHFNINELALVVNGKLIPQIPYKPDFGNKKYIREYQGFLEGLTKTYSIHPVPLTPDEFGNGFTSFAFDLTPDQNCERTHSPQGTGSVRMLMKFSQSLAQAIDVVLIAEYDSWIEIDKFKNVTTAFN